MGKYKPLTKEQNNFIIENYDVLKYKELAEALNLSVTKIVFWVKQFQQQGIIQEKPRRRNWTKAQEELLVKLIEEKSSLKELEKQIGLSQSSILAKLKQLKKKNIIKDFSVTRTEGEIEKFGKIFNSDIKEWSDEEINFLKINCANKTAKFLALQINHGMYDVICKLRTLKDTYKMNANTIRSLEAFSEEEDKYIVENFEKGLKQDILTYIPNKDWKCIMHRAKMFGISRTVQIPYDEIVFENYLKKWGIPFKKQQRIYYNNVNFYSVDFVLYDKYVVEVQGDYWHCHPSAVPNPNHKQKQTIQFDIEKRNFLKNQGYEVLWLWEHEILQDEINCKNILIKFCPLMKKNP